MNFDRVILHVDCNCFFASVETVFEPSYRTVPMAVCGSVEDRHGIVLAKNELAKNFGIQTAETVGSALKKCPSLVICPPHYDRYVDFSHRVREIYSRFTDEIEPFGLDECWLDVTRSRIYGTGFEIAEKIRALVKEEVGITVSVGVSFNKVFAKFGSDYKKPDATTVIDRENYQKILYNEPASKMLFVGGKTENALRVLGIRTIGDLARADRRLLEERLGKAGVLLSIYARGEDDSPVAEDTADPKSVGNGFTFPKDLTTLADERAELEHLSEEIGTKLRERGQVATTVTLRIKDNFLKVYQKQSKIECPTDISREIAEAAYRLLVTMWGDGKPVRALTVTASGLFKKEDSCEQISLFPDEKKEKRRTASREREVAVDEIRDRFGKNAIFTAQSIPKK